MQLNRAPLEDQSAWTRLALAVSVVVCGSGLLLLCLTLVDRQLDGATVLRFDGAMVSRVHGWTSTGLTTLMLALTTVGKIEVFGPACLVTALVLWVRERRREGIMLAGTVAGAMLVNAVLKQHFHRARPTVAWSIGDEKTFSFPSGHSLFAVVVYGVLVYLLWPWVRSTAGRFALLMFAAAMIVGIGLSRIYLGMHFPSDVCAGWFTGAAWLGMAIAVDRISLGGRVVAEDGTSSPSTPLRYEKNDTSKGMDDRRQES